VSGAAPTLRVAMVGAGGFAARHLEVLRREPGAQIVGHVSRTLAAAEAQARRYGGRAFGDVEELLTHARPDAAWITVPPHAHGRIEHALIAAGVPFFVEKPLSGDRATGEKIGRAVADAGMIAAVGYHWRALDTIAELRARLAEGPPVALVTGAWHSSTPPPAWWRSQARSGGQFVEQATHLLDLARHLLGEAVVTHAAADRRERPRFPEADVADVSAATLRFDAGALGMFTATCLLGASARVELQLMREGELITVTQGSVVYDDGRERREVRVTGDPVATEDRAFLEALRSADGGVLVCDYADALRTHELAHEVVAAAR
jgi:myo-inositol 2-dehydrogenase / D-chiro-inositol 1-dehydrogenase